MYVEVFKNFKFCRLIKNKVFFLIDSYKVFYVVYFFMKYIIFNLKKNDNICFNL